MCVAAGIGRATARRVSTDTPLNLTPSLDHVVTQWMSPSKVDGARVWISSQFQVVGCSTSPRILNVHVSVDSLGVASAVSTGQSEPTSYWPGGRRRSRVPSPRPRKPLVNLIAPVLLEIGR